MLESDLTQILKELSNKNLLRSMRRVDGAQGREVLVDGQRLINFCSNNYLGLADDPRLVSAAQASLHTEGFGAGASRLVCGNLTSHRLLEEKLALFKGTEAALVFSSGYMANTGIIPALFGRGDTIFSDRLNHASIIDGILLSRAEFKRYPHRDMTALRKLLQEAPQTGKRVIITDSVFSMDGDVAPLPDIVDLARAFEAMVMVDEAHGLGVFGAQGKGVVEHFGLEQHIDIQMGTLSKAVGAFGAYVCGSQKLIQVLINSARSLIYTTGLPPSVAAASIAGLGVIESEPDRRRQLWENTRRLLNELRDLGFDTHQTESPIIPVLVGDEALAMTFSHELLQSGFLVSAIRPPTVPLKTARLRITVMSTHTPRDLDELLFTMKKIGKKLCLI